MARPIKKGLDFFPFDVAMDDNLELIEAEHGLEGFAIVVKLWQKIYANGYYIEWEEDNALLFARRINSELTKVNDVINSCFKRNLFDKNLFNSHKILTSRGVQKRYSKICADAKRKNSSIEDQHNLINPELTQVNSEETQVNLEFSTQSKVKENKVNIEAFFNECWANYPNKKGKGAISDKAKKRSYGYGEEFKRALERFKKDVKGKDKQYIMHGSTFWNSGYVDYLDQEITPEVKRPKLTFDEREGA